MTLNLRKLAQIVNYLLARYDYKLNYTKLIKELYISDKRALEHWDTTLTTDAHYSMKNGPVLSTLYDLIKGSYSDSDDQNNWNNFFIREGYDLISLVEEKMPYDELSPREIELLDNVDEEYHEKGFRWMISHVHNKRLFPEHRDPEGTSVLIPLEKILKSVGRDDAEAEEIAAEIEGSDREAQFLKSCCE